MLLIVTNSVIAPIVMPTMPARIAILRKSFCDTT